jgi:hypothetical protein
MTSSPPAVTTFQVIRRTIATLAQKKGTVKDVQGVLRHSRAATTTDVYMQEIPKSVLATVDSINEELRKKSKPMRNRKESVANEELTASQYGRGQSVLTPNDTNRLVEKFVSSRKDGGPGRDRTDDLFHAMEARSHLRHRPIISKRNESGSRQYHFIFADNTTSFSLTTGG